VDNFGVCGGLVLRDISPGVTVFYGHNEAGKTTLLNFVRTMLYGFSPQCCQRYLPAADGKPVGGTLSVQVPHGRFQIQRHVEAGCAGGSGHLAITAREGTPQGIQLLSTFLAGVDETIFHNVYAIGLNQLQRLATLDDAEVAVSYYIQFEHHWSRVY
jgi:uncharacterized protein YhaN